MSIINKTRPWGYIGVLVILVVIEALLYFYAPQWTSASSIYFIPILFFMLLFTLLSIIFIFIKSTDGNTSLAINVMSKIWPLLGVTLLVGVAFAMIMFVMTSSNLSSTNALVQLALNATVFCLVAGIIYRTIDTTGPVGAFIKGCLEYVPCLTTAHRSIKGWAGMLTLVGGFLYFLIKGLIAEDHTNWSWWILELLMIIGVGITLKLFFWPSASMRKGPLYRTINALVLYIPCMITRMITQVVPKSPEEEREMKMLATSTFFMISYFFMTNYITPWLVDTFFKQKGTQILNSPKTLSYPDTLTGAPDQPGNNYQYAISFWVYIDSFASNTNAGYRKTNNRILSYGGMPHISYDAVTNAMIFSVQSDTNTDNSTSTTKNRTIYRHENVKLQKWNYIVLNYNGGTLDIFYNGELQKSAPNAVVFQDQAMLECGEKNGIHGDICNIMYYDTPIELPLINRMYTAFRDQNPPHISTSIWTITPLG